ncbi:arf-GAP with Rho-GAP domain, ANK repeat and PH domain-containing protein 3 [Ixodes scapularis]|uniref:arf-GAP with Rho-GAP domain, ANK repeat and PH domain-containing protein 3 n=1 Tax=Ixodes scapularis TaxID=6945 RepID=UPI001C38848B|nr:arf-GAP with Rho-GAP domain, ANK repeat and PH domain-containing protein 3 [Ixodes scapularis]
MTDTPPILPRRPKPPFPLEATGRASPPISLDTKVPRFSLAFKAPKQPPPCDAGEPTPSAQQSTSVPVPQDAPQPAPAQNFTNPIYLLMDDRLNATSSDPSPSPPPRTEQRKPNFSDTDSIMFLKRNRPKLQRQKSEEIPDSPQLPPARFPHIYEDVPEHMLEKNRQLASQRDAFSSISFESPLSSHISKEGSTESSHSSASLYDTPREPSEPKRDVSTFWQQQQLSISGVFYEFPVVHSPPTKSPPQAYDTPPSITRLASFPDSEGDTRQMPSSYEVPPTPVPVSSANSAPCISKGDKKDTDDFREQAQSPKQDVFAVFTPNCLYEVPKSFPRRYVSPPASPFSFPDPSEIYDVPPHRAKLSPPPQDIDLAQNHFEFDDDDPEEVPLLSPPPSYPPPPLPEVTPPAIPPRTYLQNSPPLTPQPDKSVKPIPAVRTSLSKRLPQERSKSNATPSPLAERKESFASPSPSASVFYRTFPAEHAAFSGSLTSSAEQSPTFSQRSVSSKSQSPVPDSPRLDCFFDGRSFSEGRERNLSQEGSRSLASDSSSSKSEADCQIREKSDYAGYVYKAAGSRKAFQKCWCTLSDGCWSYYSSEKDTTPLGTVSGHDIAAVSMVPGDEPSAATSLVPNLWCFEVHALQSQCRQLLLGVPLLSERREWLERLTRLVCAAPDAGPTSGGPGPSHAGRLHLKEGTTGFWQVATVVLRGRFLAVGVAGSSEVVDLRRVMSVGKVLPDQTYLTYGGAQERGLSFQVRLPGRVLYLQADQPRHTDAWLASVSRAWRTPPDPALSDQYLTQDGLPVAVERCINFVSTHGTLLTGIYRLAGSSSKIKKLVDHMLNDPWTLHLTTEEYSPHDVSNALKRYLRGFKDCLLTAELYPQWIQSSKCQHPSERQKMVKNLLNELPSVNYQLLKRLIGHLKSISDHSDRNFMPVLNLAPVFGPSVLYKQQPQPPEGESQASFEESNASMDVVADLLSGYSQLFEVDPAEMEKEKKIQAALDLLREAKIAQRPAGDILVGVYVYSKDWGHCINVKLSPGMTAGALCKLTMSQLDIKEPSNKMAVFEVVHDQDLERPLHHSEPVLSVVVRWAAWDSAFAKSNFLCVKNNFLYDEVAPLVTNHQPLSVFSELRFAEARQKSFKKSVFEFTGGKITHYKDTKASQLVNQWNIEDVVWYIGCESRRSPPSKWNFTFVLRQGEIKRTKERPFFGHCVSLSVQEEFEKWLAAMLNAEFPHGIFPPQPEPLPDLLG